MSRSRDFGAAASSLAAPSSANNGYNHVVDTTQASGWNFSPDANYNWLINGAADHWQRGTTWTADNKFLADRWFLMGTNAGSRSTDVPAGQGLTYSMGFAYNATGSYPRICYMMPAEDALFLAGKTVTISFWAKNVSGTAVFYGEVQSLNVSNVFDFNVAGVNSKTFAALGAMSASWQYYTWTFNIDSTVSRGFYLNFVRDPQSASSTLITGLKMELGAVATPFTRNGGDIHGELIKCQRYYWQSTGANIHLGVTNNDNPNIVVLVMQHPTQMRIAPTIVQNTAGSYFTYRGYNSGTSTFTTGTFSTFTQETSSIYSASIYGSPASFTVPNGASGRIYINNAAGYLGFSAEVR